LDKALTSLTAKERIDYFAIFENLEPNHVDIDMTRLVKRKRPRKKLSEFQKLWAKAEKLENENVRFQARLDEIMQRIRTDIQPVEEEFAKQGVPLLRRLLTLGQRKSLAQWQRQELDAWIRELIEPLRSASQLAPEILEDISRYNAFSLGIELDETASTPLVDQLQDHLKRAKHQEEEEDEISEEARRKQTEEEIERILDSAFGHEPPKPTPPGDSDNDLFPNELNEELSRQFDEYHKARNAAREELLEEMLADSTPFSDAEEDFFKFDPFDASDSLPEEEDDDNNDAPKITSVVFTRLFRSTAAQLHPDRELDPVLRQQKQALMAELLGARRQGDVMTVINLYQQHVDNDATLSKADEKQLTNALKRQITALESKREEYSFESPLHRTAFAQFYHQSSRQTNQALNHHIQKMEAATSEVVSQTHSIKTLKTLKPHLEERYEEHRFDNPFEALEEIFNLSR